jgi:ATP phosphoribosyltransferase
VTSAIRPASAATRTTRTTRCTTATAAAARDAHGRAPAANTARLPAAIARCGPSLATGRFRLSAPGVRRPPPHHAFVLRIALPNKGRLADEARELFADAGLPVRARGDRALTASLGGEFEAIFVRAQDIPEFVADGAADAGVTGWDLVCESGRGLDSLLDLGFGRCRIVVAAKEDARVRSVDDIGARDGEPPVRVATVFPQITRRYFAEAGRTVEIAPISGAVEIAPHLGIADVIVDLTSTGSTLKMNGLRELATVLESTRRLVAAPGALAAAGAAPTAKQRAVDELVTALASVLRARDKRYVMANVPRAALDEVKRVLPASTARP